METVKTLEEIQSSLRKGKKSVYGFSLNSERGILNSMGKSVPLLVYGIFTKDAVGNTRCFGSPNLAEKLMPICQEFQGDIEVYYRDDRDCNSSTIFFVENGEATLVDEERFPCFSVFAVAKIKSGNEEIIRHFELSQFPREETAIFCSTENEMFTRVLTKNFFWTVQLFGAEYEDHGDPKQQQPEGVQQK